MVFRKGTFKNTFSATLVPASRVPDCGILILWYWLHYTCNALEKLTALIFERVTSLDVVYLCLYSKDPALLSSFVAFGKALVFHQASDFLVWFYLLWPWSFVNIEIPYYLMCCMELFLTFLLTWLTPEAIMQSFTWRPCGLFTWQSMRPVHVACGLFMMQACDHAASLKLNKQ